MFLTCGKIRRNELTSPFLFDDFDKFVERSITDDWESHGTIF